MQTLLTRLLFVSTASAREGYISELDKLNPLGEKASILSIINRLADWLVRLAAIVVPIIIIWGAFLILTSAGQAEKVTAGKKAILYAVLGFIVVLMAKGVVAIVRETLLGVTG